MLSTDLYMDFKIASDCHTECTIDIYSHRNLTNKREPLYSVNFFDCNNYYDALMPDWGRKSGKFIMMFSFEIKFLYYDGQ